ncbi:hypothetical protein [Alkalimarinus sediminis]|uniref:Uncharacterized protein n=1 Tax=Alkalimarinus sediminis TaxID=1632866 RepID=A0A9E8KNG2_9ALTE|nr:hypothetical protein [Alkalimarinus sediminis]UZW74318.1 hypothetical protein NNL22_15010 [Alkalimarinus sediminis]
MMNVQRFNSLVAGALFFAVASVASAGESASTEDAILLAECGGFFNAYGTLVGRADLSSTGSRLASKVLDREGDVRSVAVSFERGGEFAESWHHTNEQAEVVDYIQMCSRVVSRNMEYLKATT